MNWITYQYHNFMSLLYTLHISEQFLLMINDFYCYDNEYKVYLLIDKISIILCSNMDYDFYSMHFFNPFPPSVPIW